MPYGTWSTADTAAGFFPGGGFFPGFNPAFQLGYQLGFRNGCITCSRFGPFFGGIGAGFGTGGDAMYGAATYGVGMDTATGFY